MKSTSWLIYSLITTVTWGIWGALIEFPEKWGFPATMGYIIWAVSMLPCSLVALKFAGWKLDYSGKAIFLGSLIGLLGAGGQLLLFIALRQGPAYIIFPVVSLYPVLTILLSVLFLKERANRSGRIGIFLAVIAIALLSYQPPAQAAVSSHLWLVLAILVFVMWALQAFVMKFSNHVMSAESIFFYMMLTSLLLTPFAFLMTDMSQPINWGWNGPYVSFAIQALNSVGALYLVYALRYGKAIVVVPMTSLAPVITIVLSLCIHAVLPHWVLLFGMLVASYAIYLLSLEGETESVTMDKEATI